MHKILIIGAGKIGPLVATLLTSATDYQVYLADINIDSTYLKNFSTKNPRVELVKLDGENHAEMAEFLKKNSIAAIASCLPFFRNVPIMKLAKEFNLNYFDLTEDTETAKVATELSKQATNAFVPQCGLAPGFISIVAHDLMRHFEELDTVKLRVGALPVNTSNALQYSLTWSIDGLINEYGNLCQAVNDGQEVRLLPLDDIEHIKIDGLTYESFNTSGGIGTLVDTYLGKVQELNYKTIRYPGHCKKMRFLMNDLKLNHDRDTLKRILENSLPKNSQDVVLVYVSVAGKQNNQYTEQNYVKKFYPKKINDLNWSAIQLTTASALAAIIDLVMTNKEKYRGLVRQEQFSLEALTTNRFGQYYA